MRRIVIKSLLFGSVLAASAGSVARVYYEVIPYYANNPFLFCTFGVPQDCWFPINPATGAFGVWNGYCFNPVSAAQYVRLCPHAFLPTAGVDLSVRRTAPARVEA